MRSCLATPLTEHGWKPCAYCRLTFLGGSSRLLSGSLDIILSNRVPRISVKEARARALVLMVLGLGAGSRWPLHSALQRDGSRGCVLGLYRGKNGLYWGYIGIMEKKMETTV